MKQIDSLKVSATHPLKKTIPMKSLYSLIALIFCLSSFYSAELSAQTVTKQLYLSTDGSGSPDQDLDRIDPVATSDATTDTTTWDSTGLTFSQSPSMACDFTISSVGAVTVTVYVDSDPGTDATAALSIDGGAAFLTLTTPTYNAGAGTATWTGTLPSETTVSAGQAIDLTLDGLSGGGTSDGMVGSEQKISDTEGGFTATLDNSDQFGQSFAGIGDLDNDGIEDIAVGTDKDDDGGTDRGAVQVLRVNADGTAQSEPKISDTEGGFTATLDNSD